MRYIILNLIALLFITGLNAAESFVYTGVVTENDGANKMLINGQHYLTNFDTVVHGGLSMQGELGPMINIGQRIGFNIEQNNDELPHISEIWILN